MNIMVTAATENEWKPLHQLLATSAYNIGNNIHLHWHTSGVGMMLSTLSLYKEIISTKPDLLFQVGIAGSLNPAVALGTVLLVGTEYLGDTGVEEAGKFNDMFDLQLAGGNDFPFTKKGLKNPWLDHYNFLGLPIVAAVTVNEITTRSVRIKQLTEQYGAVIESMEGAALHFSALHTAIPFVQMRAISNFAGERDKSKWQLKLSIEQLATTAADWLVALSKQVANET